MLCPSARLIAAYARMKARIRIDCEVSRRETASTPEGDTPNAYLPVSWHKVRPPSGARSQGNDDHSSGGHLCRRLPPAPQARARPDWEIFAAVEDGGWVSRHQFNTTPRSRGLCTRARPNSSRRRPLRVSEASSHELLRRDHGPQQWPATQRPPTLERYGELSASWEGNATPIYTRSCLFPANCPTPAEPGVGRGGRICALGLGRADLEALSLVLHCWALC